MATSDITAFNRDGELVVDSRLIAERLGIEHESFVETIKKYKTDAASVVKSIAVRTETNKKPGQRGYKHHRYYLLNKDQAVFFLSKTRYGLDKEDVDFIKSQHGMDLSQCIGLKKRTVGTAESYYSNLVAQKLDGAREVETPVGNIDVLTNKELIEVKALKSWKHALGQVLAYSYYYPKHKKVICLYGAGEAKLVKVIKTHCKVYGVSVRVLTKEDKPAPMKPEKIVSAQFSIPFA